MDTIDLEIPGVKLLKPRCFLDDRGFFKQTYHQRMYADAGIHSHFVQDNWSRSGYGVLRGLHYQLENPQAKLVSVMQGEVFDVVVDIRKGSPTFGKWCGALLNEENHHQLFVPAGCAHGFVVLSDVVDFMYKCDNFYTQGDEYAIRWDDPVIGIEWPQLRGDPQLSRKDLNAPLLADVPVENLPIYKASGKGKS